MFRLPLLTWARPARRPVSLKPSIPLLGNIPGYATIRRYSIDSVENPDDPGEIEDFGQYSIILPPEPFVFGVSHIKRRHVPENIVKPSYVQEGGSDTVQGVEKPESIIELGGEAEMRLRNAARLAKDVREFGGSLVKVGIRCPWSSYLAHCY